MSRFEVDGWVVAHVDLERRWSHRDIPDRCWLFRSSSAWTLVTVRRNETYGDTDRPVGGRAAFTAGEFATIGELAAHVDDAYGEGGWVDLLDAGAGHDDDLYRAWVP